MQRLCPNCGDPVEPDEVFCDKCGTRVAQEPVVENQYQAQTPNPYQNPYQAPTPNPYQGQSQTPTPGSYQSQYSYIPGQQMNTPSYTPPPVYPSSSYSQGQKPKTGSKALKIIFICISVVAILIVLLGVIGLLMEDKDKNNTNNNTKPSDVKPAGTEVNKPSPAESSKPSQGKSLAAWDIEMNAVASYASSEKKIYVEYKASVKNTGSVSAQKINLYLDPDPNDANAEYLSINERTIVNYEQGVIEGIGAGQTEVITTKFFYNDIEPQNAGQSVLQDVANRFVKIPLYIEWQENGTVYNARLTLK